MLHIRGAEQNKIMTVFLVLPLTLWLQEIINCLAKCIIWQMAEWQRWQTEWKTEDSDAVEMIISPFFGIVASWPLQPNHHPLGIHFRWSRRGNNGFTREKRTFYYVVNLKRKSDKREWVGKREGERARSISTSSTSPQHTHYHQYCLYDT